MKRYCKNIDITDKEFIKGCIYECLDGKWRRSEVHKLLAKYGSQSRSQIYRICTTTNTEIIKQELSENIVMLANEISISLKNHAVDLPDIQYKTIIDGNSGKERSIGRESMIHQIYDYIAVRGAQELFDKKIGVYQCASIPGRGQIYGKKAIERWIRRSVSTTKYAIKADIKKCYPSIDQECLIGFLRRDIKNDTLLWLMEYLISQFETGLSIGSYLSQYLCNYYLSYAYHYATEQLAITKIRRSKTQRIRLVNHVLFYMDDILLLGGNKKHLKQGFEMFNKYVKECLKLEIKDSWKIFRVQYYDKDGKSHGDIIDMMGYRIGRRYTTVRKKIFRKLRRKILKIEKYTKRGKEAPIELARGASSFYGWLVNSDSYNFVNAHKNAFAVANNIISDTARNKQGGKQC